MQYLLGAVKAMFWECRFAIHDEDALIFTAA